MANGKARAKRGSDPVEEEVGGLYLGDFDDFVGRRNELAKRLRDENAEGAERVRALKKPSRVAWAINQLSEREPALRDGLLDAGDALRSAQERVVAGKAGSAEIREASDAERGVVDEVLEAVGALAQGAGAKLSLAAFERARQTLHAVSLDDDVRREFRAHRLTTEHEAAGLGAFSLGAEAGTPAKQGRAKLAQDAQRESAKRRRDELKLAEDAVRERQRRHEEAEREVEEARVAAKRAQRDMVRATEQLEKASREAAEAKSRADELRAG